MLFIEINLIMKLNVLQIIYFCLINYGFTFPLFDELWETNQSEPQPNNNPIESQLKIKVEPHEEQFDGRWQDESALKGIVKVEHEPHYGAVKVEGKDKIKHEFEWRDKESGEFKEQTEDHVKEEDQDGQPANISDQKNNGLFDELWEPNKTEPQSNPIESQSKIKVEPHEEQFDGRWQDESALKGNVNVEHEPPFGTVKVEGTDKIKHEFEWWGEESDEFKKQLDNRVKEEDQDGQAPNTFDHKKIGDNSNKHLSDQNNSTDQDENADKQNDFNKCEKIESDQQKREIIQKFREMKEDYTKNRKYTRKDEWAQIERKISNGLGVGRTKIYKWIKELGLNQETKFNSKFSESEKLDILKQFDKIKSKCKQANLKNFSKNELDKKIAKKLGVSKTTLIRWKREFGLPVNNKFSDATKIGILKKYAKIKRKNPKMTDAVIADILKISTGSLSNWKKQFKEEIKNL